MAKVTSKTGEVLGTIRLTGPDQLPVTLDLPDSTNLGIHANADSYIAPLPSAWIQPGIQITVSAGSGAGTKVLADFMPRVGADIDTRFLNGNLALWDENSYGYMAGLGSWGQDALSVIPTRSFTLSEYPSLLLDRQLINLDGLSVYTGNQGNTSGIGTDSLLSGVVSQASSPSISALQARRSKGPTVPSALPTPAAPMPVAGLVAV